MSIDGYYARLSPTDLGRALADPDTARELTDPQEQSPDRRHCVGPYWDAIAFLLRRRGFPVDLVRGGTELTGAADLGFGPPRYLTPDQVRCAVEALEAVTPDALAQDVTGADLTAAGVHPLSHWDHDGSLDSAAGAYQDLLAFLRTTARYHQAVLFWTA
ncbi:YfbM family protein [Kitasatospora sp. NPDC001664]|uniref:YfbM family protein n=1 Tax=Kitasatospora albolonga TaxID=68173 RepID=UPI0035E6E141